MKRFLALTMTGIMLLSSNVLGATNIFYNDSLVTYTDQTPVIINDRTYVPIRDVFEKMGFQVKWNADTQLIYIMDEYYKIFINTNNNMLFAISFGLDTVCFELDDPIQLVNGRTMLPLRQILESVNYEIRWEPATKSSVIVNKNDYDKMLEKLNEYDKICEELSDFEIDNTKEVGDFTQEEYTFFDEFKAALAEALKSYKEKKTYDERLDELLSSLDAIKEISCPESLNNFNVRYVDNLKNTFEYIDTNDEYLERLYGDANMYTEIDDLLTEIYDFKVSLDMAPLLKDVYNIEVERNIPGDIVMGVL